MFEALTSTRRVQGIHNLVSVIPSEVFSLHQKLKKQDEQASSQYILHVLIVVLGRDVLNTIAIEELSSRCVFEGLSLLICWSVEEAASYINTIKVLKSQWYYEQAYETRGNDIIQKHTNRDLRSQAIHVLTSINGVNV